MQKEIALGLCREVRTQNKNKFFSFGKVQCYFCWKFGRKRDENGNYEITNICALNDGCYQVNKLYQELHIQ